MSLTYFLKVKLERCLIVTFFDLKSKISQSRCGHKRKKETILTKWHLIVNSAACVALFIAVRSFCLEDPSVRVLLPIFAVRSPTIKRPFPNFAAATTPPRPRFANFLETEITILKVWMTKITAEETLARSSMIHRAYSKDHNCTINDEKSPILQAVITL